MEIKVLAIIQSSLATNISDGVALFDAIKNHKPSEITISFIGVDRLSSLFLNESIGQYVLQNSKSIQDLNFIYPKGKEMFQYKVEDIIENALLGDEYDEFVDNALVSM